MFENLQVFENRYEELNLKLYDPSTAADRELYTKLMKEHAEITPIVEKYRIYKNAQKNLAEAKELLEDKEMKEIALEEMAEAKKTIEETEEELKVLLLPKDPNDDKNVIVEIEAARAEKRLHFCGCTFQNVFLLCREARLES